MISKPFWLMIEYINHWFFTFIINKFCSWLEDSANGLNWLKNFINLLVLSLVSILFLSYSASFPFSMLLFYNLAHSKIQPNMLLLLKLLIFASSSISYDPLMWPTQLFGFSMYLTTYALFSCFNLVLGCESKMLWDSKAMLLKWT